MNDGILNASDRQERGHILFIPQKWKQTVCVVTRLRSKLYPDLHSLSCAASPFCLRRSPSEWHYLYFILFIYLRLALNAWIINETIHKANWKTAFRNTDIIIFLMSKENKSSDLVRCGTVIISCLLPVPVNERLYLLSRVLIWKTVLVVDWTRFL